MYELWNEHLGTVLVQVMNKCRSKLGLGEFRAECVRAEQRPTHPLKVGEEAEPHQLLEILAIVSFFYTVICQKHKYYIKCREKLSKLLFLPHFLHHLVNRRAVQPSSSGSRRKRGSAQHFNWLNDLPSVYRLINLQTFLIISLLKNSMG